ncbi:MAG TPA: Ig-like domain repeat protein [Thermoanaerobaculia bacterium]|nr:Ig-like domain repeat protein [Thermoanaerobaculia bacterium]
MAGQNINMVSGTAFPGGDPFLQRQNEPSLAVSSRNAQHLLAGANDYRTVDLPVSDTVPGSLAGDAWLGVFKSFDGAQSWQSTLLPGFPQDQSPAGLASPLKAYNAAADPTVRAGTSGLIYYSGIAFNRGTNNGAVFVARYLDANQKENGDATTGKDTIKYISTGIVDNGTSGQFIDKPWIAVDVPRSGAGTCTFNPFGTPQTVPAGNVYLVWSRFTGSTSTKIMFSRSTDCGQTWANPQKLSESNSINQGTNVAIDPVSGAVYVAWRRFAASQQPDAIVVAKSTDFGKTFASKNTVVVANIAPFDQATMPGQFRTNALPTIAVSVDSANNRRVHVAWAQRDAASGDGRVVMSTSTDGTTWSAPAQVASAPITDDFGNVFQRGHQFMPQLTFVAGRLVLVYYDQRLDHTLGFHIPNDPFAPDAQGRFYLVRQDPQGELPANPQQVFTLGINDATLTVRRHTVDLRVGTASPAASPSFSASTVSEYRFGLTATDGGMPAGLSQLQVNAPNLPLFSQGTLPFLGDYIDVAGQNFNANGAGGWTFNTSSSNPFVAYASWTDNRDVKPPVDGNWANYTPTGLVHQSVLDPTQQTPPCVVGQEGMRDQNIYSSRITEGLIVGSPQNVKPLSSTLQRSFVVTLQNLTSQQRTFHLTVTQPAGGQASFMQSTSQTALDVTIDAHSGAARPVFAKSSTPAAGFVVNVSEVGGSLSGSIVMNPEGSVSPLAQPDGTTADIGTLEIYTPLFQVWNAANPNPYLNISNPNQVLNISNLNISNVDPAILNISNLNISNLNISNLNISNPDPAALNISNLNISNTAAANLNISNLNISNLNISNTPISESTYAVVNSGNTSHSYRVALYGNNPYNTPLQVIVTKNSTMPASASCTLLNQPQNVVVSNVNDALISPDLASASNPDIADSSVDNTTMEMAPGETVFVTLRAALTSDQMATLTQNLTPVITAHGTNTNGSVPDFVALLFIQVPNGGALPAAVVGTSYTTTLTAAGGKPPLTWVLAPGSVLPTGLTLSTGGVISGTPSGSGSFTFSVKVSDSTAGTPQTATQTFQLTVNARSTATSVAFGANPISFGQSTSATVTVTDTQVGGTASSPTGTVALTGSGLSAGSCVLAPSGASASACSVTVTPPAAGTDVIGATFTATSVHLASNGSNTLTVNPAGTATALISSLNPSQSGQSVTFTATVTSAAGLPTGTVSFLDGAATLATSPLTGNVATFTTSSLIIGVHPITAVYGGAPNYAGSTSAVLNQTVLGFYTFTGFLSPMSTAGTIAAPTFSGNANYGSATPIKWTLQDGSGNVLTDLTTTLALTAVKYTGSSCSGQATGTATLLYSPTAGAKGGSTFRNSNGQFIFNWDTTVVGGKGCYELELQFNDGSPIRATVEKLQ